MRLRDWQSRLDAVVRRRLHTPLTWGANDCCLFAADCVEAVTGADPAADLRGAYSDEIGAARLLKQLGGVVEIACERLGHVIRTELAQPGDVGLTVCDGRQTLVVCVGGHWLGPGHDGLITFLPDQVQRAWRCSKD